MDKHIESLRIELASFYSGEKSLEGDREALAQLSMRARESYGSVRPGSLERRWLEGLFRTLKEWGLDEWGPEAGVRASHEARRPATFRDGMPAAVPYFVGREPEKARLTRWVDDGASRIVQVIAAGGYGKTQLVNNWLQQTIEQNNGSRPVDAVFCWCFYTTQERLPNYNGFFSEAIQFFEAALGRRTAIPPQERPAYLAGLVAAGRHLVVLDGLEALQKKPKSSRPSDEDRDNDADVEPGTFRKRFREVETFLHEAARHRRGKIVITSRQGVKTLVSSPSVVDITLLGLDAANGVAILQRLGVRGSAESLATIVSEVAGHPLTLGLMGFALAWHHDGHASQYRRVQLTRDAGIGGAEDGPGDEDVTRSYLRWLRESPETELLRLVGFFHQQKIFLKDLESLIMCDEIRPVFPNLWQSVQADGGGLRWEALYEALWALQESMLLLGDVRRRRRGRAGAVGVRLRRPSPAKGLLRGRDPGHGGRQVLACGADGPVRGLFGEGRRQGGQPRGRAAALRRHRLCLPCGQVSGGVRDLLASDPPQRLDIIKPDLVCVVPAGALLGGPRRAGLVLPGPVGAAAGGGRQGPDPGP